MRDGARVAGADGSAVDFGDGGDFGGGAGEEAFIGDVQIMPLERFFGAGDLKFFAELDDHGAGDAFENAIVGGGRGDVAVADDENIVGGALGDVAVVIEHDRLGHAGVGGFDFGENVVQIIQALDAWGDGVGMVADHRGDDDRHSLLIHLSGVHLNGVGDDEDRGLGTFIGGQTEIASATRDDDANIGIGKIIGFEGLLDGRFDLSRGKGNGQADGTGGII